MLVRSTFGLRGCPPNRRSAPHLRRITRPLCASHNSARFNGHSPFPHFHIPILPHYIRFGLWLWFWVVVWVMVWLWLSAFRVVVEGSAAKVSSPRSARWFSLRAKERERKKPLARRARARLVHSLSPTAVGGGPTGFPLASPNARPPLPPHHSSDRLRWRPSVGGYPRGVPRDSSQTMAVSSLSRAGRAALVRPRSCATPNSRPIQRGGGGPVGCLRVVLGKYLR